MTYRWNAESTRSKQTPSCRLRTRTTYSACDQHSGIAAPVGLPFSMPCCGRSAASQSCSVIMPPALAKYHPILEVRNQPVGIFQQEKGGIRFMALLGDLCGSHEPGDNRSKRRRRVAGVFFPE